MKTIKMNKKPFVSIIAPVYNEGRTIRNCIEALLKQDYPKGRFEIIFADGNSFDNTKEIIKEYQKKHKNIVLLDNPERNTATGRNICLKHAKGDIIINYSGHAAAQPNLLSVLAGKLVKSPKEIGGVGCSNIPADKDALVSGCIGVVFSSWLGGMKNAYQNMKFDNERIVESIAFTAYRKEVFSKIGNFDPKLWVGQDGELNLRLNNAGYRLLYTPETFVTHYKRAAIGKFWKQMYNYGIAAFLRIRKHPDSFKMIYIMPSLFVVYVVFGLLASLLDWRLFQLYAASLFAYAVFGFFNAVMVSKDCWLALCCPLFYFVEHFGYGLGFLKGMFFRRF